MVTKASAYYCYQLYLHLCGDRLFLAINIWFHLNFGLHYRMEFGLQKAEKTGSPALVGNPRKRVEAKAYRARDRMDNGWFRHDGVNPEDSPNVSPRSSPLCGRNQVPSNLPKASVHCSCAQQLYKNTAAAGVPSEHVDRARTSSKVQSPLPEYAARFQQEVFPSCSFWYRHEHTVVVDETEPEQQKKEHDQCYSPGPVFRSSEPAAGHFSPQSRRVCAKAEEYWKRNHDGSTKDWFRHEHTLVAEKENIEQDGNIVEGDH